MEIEFEFVVTAVVAIVMAIERAPLLRILSSLLRLRLRQL